MSKCGNIKKGRPSAGGSYMSGVWGRDKPRQTFSPTVTAGRLRRIHDLVLSGLASHHCTRPALQNVVISKSDLNM